jgi:lipopolysaccharide/colanic/teichoic acid biosynthesis glycosyltransferase
MTSAPEGLFAMEKIFLPSRLNSLPGTSAGPAASCKTNATGIESKQANSSLSGRKRVLDVVCVVLSLPFVVPLMALIVLWIRLVSRGPALFCQERIGQGGKRFVLYKFRSMRMSCGTHPHEVYLTNLVESNSPMMKLDLLSDSRVIPGGCILRSAGLDELPQLLNVLRGEMSLVGPRPCLPEEYRFFSPQQRERFKALPGLTGVWQVNGKNQATFREMNMMDVYYANHASLGLDIAIILKTPAALLLQTRQAIEQTEARRKTISSKQPVASQARKALSNRPAK